MRYRKNSFIFIISMVDLVGFDVYMSHIVKIKFRTLTTSSGLVLGPTVRPSNISVQISMLYKIIKNSAGGELVLSPIGIGIRFFV